MLPSVKPHEDFAKHLELRSRDFGEQEGALGQASEQERRQNDNDLVAAKECKVVTIRMVNMIIGFPYYDNLS